MKEFVESLGGAFWATFTALSVIVTVALGFGLPKLVDTSNPWVVFIACSLVFIVGFFNGWKQRGFKNGRDMELADRLERERLELAKSNEAEIARINAEKELELDRRNREAEGLKRKAEAEKELAERRRRRDASFFDASMKMGEGLRRMLATIRDEGSVVIEDSDFKYEYRTGHTWFLMMVNEMRIDDYEAEYTLKEGAVEFMSEHQNMFYFEEYD